MCAFRPETKGSGCSGKTAGVLVLALVLAGGAYYGMFGLGGPLVDSQGSPFSARENPHQVQSPILPQGEATRTPDARIKLGVAYGTMGATAVAGEAVAAVRCTYIVRGRPDHGEGRRSRQSHAFP